MSDTQRTYIAIDLKSFYASVECADRGLDPLTTNLVVADISRTEKTICLAVSPSLKALGISGRARLFEVVQRVREVNYREGKNIEYIVAPPRMARYLEVSRQVNEIYQRFIAPEDIHIYSCDEVFMDVTAYLSTYKMSAHELAMTIIRDVLRETKITATAGIGTNMYLCKVAMDVVAKHIPADEDGVRIAELNERSYRELLWNHTPLTDFWRFGRGIANKLEGYGIDTMGKLARLSLTHEDFLYGLFGVNAELIIDHAWGYEPCTIKDVKSYRPKTNSFSSGQVLHQPYTFDMARVVVQEMADALALDMVDKRLVTNQIVLTVGYDAASLTTPSIAEKYDGEITVDHYGRQVPKHAHGTRSMNKHTSSSKTMIDTAISLYDSIVNRELLIRRLNITVNHVIYEDEAKEELKQPQQLDLFTDYKAIEAQRLREAQTQAKERRIQETLLKIKKQYGKNAVLRGVSFADGATQIERNNQIGGHKA